MLLPPDLRDWVDEEDMVHFVIEAVDRLPLECFKVNQRGSGSKQHSPHMMLALLIYCYSNRIFSSRKIERATYRDVAVRYLTADNHPDHDTICKFRRENKQAISKAFVEILQLAKELGLLKVGKVSTDGTHLKANASINQNISYKRAKQLKKRLEQDVAELMLEAEKADNTSEEGQSLPKEISRREKLSQKMDEAITNLKEQAEKEHAQAQKNYEEKIKERCQKEKETGKKTRGKKPQPPKSAEEIAEQSKRNHNFTDPDSQVMRKSKASAYTQSYNAQASVDSDGSQLIVGHHIGDCSNDKNEMLKAYESIPEEVGKPTHQIFDAGYVNIPQIEELENRTDVEVYVSVHREDAHHERQYDYRPEEKLGKPRQTVIHPTLLKMKAKLETEEGSAIYKLRSQTIETTFGIIKEAMGFRNLLLRGAEKIALEWELMCTSYNLKRLFNLKRS